MKRPLCNEALPVEGSIVPYCCTLPRGHRGPHKAQLGGTGKVMASWTGWCKVMSWECADNRKRIPDAAKDACGMVLCIALAFLLAFCIEALVR